MNHTKATTEAILWRFRKKQPERFPTQTLERKARKAHRLRLQDIRDADTEWVAQFTHLE